MKSSVLKLSFFPGPRRMQGGQEWSNGVWVSWDACGAQLPDIHISELVSSYPEPPKYWVHFVNEWNLGLKLLILGTAGFIFAHLFLKGVGNSKELVIFLFTPPFPIHFQRTISIYLTRPSWLWKTWLLECFLVYGVQLTVPSSLLPPNTASRFRECHQHDATPPRGVWQHHMATGIQSYAKCRREDRKSVV